MKSTDVKIGLINLAHASIGKKLTNYALHRYYVSKYKRARVIFVHIPKAGGTSITNLIYGSRVGHLPASTTRAILGHDKYVAYFSFSIVRNPYERLVSAYNFARQGGGTEGSVRNKKLYRGEAFSTFDRFVRQWLVEQDLAACEIIFKPQHLYLYESGECLVDWIGRLENMDEVEEKLHSILGRSVTVGRLNSSRRDRPYMNYYDKRLKQIVYDLYAEDFELLGYRK